MTDRFMNEEFQTSEERGPVWLGRNYADGADTRQDSAIWINATGTTRGLGYAGFTFDVDEAERFRDHLTALIEDVKSRKPKEPTRAERWAAAPLGAVITPHGLKPVGDVPYRVKVGPDTWVSKYPENGGVREISFHESWDLVKEEN